MRRKIYENLLWIFGIIFLLISLWFKGKAVLNYITIKFDLFIPNLPLDKINEIKNQTIMGLWNTDGLALVGVLLALYSSIMWKISFIRKVTNYLILNYIPKNINYEIEVVFVTKSNEEIQYYIDKFWDTAKSFSKFKSSNHTVLNSSNKIHLFDFTPMASKIEIKFLKEQCKEKMVSEKYWKITNKGICTFRTINLNKDFLLNKFIEKLQEENFRLDKINFKILKQDTEIKLLNAKDINVIDDFELRKFNLLYDISLNTKIEIDSSTGITVFSDNKGDFIIAYNEFKSIITQ